MIFLDQSNRTFRVAFLGDDALTARFVADRFSGSEYLSRDFHFDVELLSEDRTVELKDVQGQMMVIWLKLPAGGERPFTGIVRHFEYVDGTVQGIHRYRAQLVPWLAYASLRSECRVYLNQTRQQQVDDLLRKYSGVADWKWQAGEDQRIHTMNVQFNETDHNFLYGRLEMDGAITRFEHHAEGHTWVVQANMLAVEPIPGPSPAVRFHQDGKSGISLQQYSITRWSQQRAWGSAVETLSSFDFKAPTPTTASIPTIDDAPGVHPVENHEFVGNYGYIHAGDGDRLARLRMEETEVRRSQWTGHSTNPYLQVGRWFRLTEHPSCSSDASANEYVISEIHYDARNNFLQRSQNDDDSEPTYNCRFVCHPKKVPWRPGRGWSSTPNRIQAPQTATVVGVGRPGALDLDEYGRVLIQFHWDRDASYTCRVRVMLPWAGAEHGVALYPRIGSEVLVVFESGNPDHPIVQGGMPNARHMPPWTLPAQSNLSGWRTRQNTEAGNSTGGPSNHLVLDDTPSQLQVQLKSDHLASQFSAGFITRIEDTSGRKEPRGQGTEVRTDGHHAERAAKGILHSTDARPNARNHITDISEASQRLQDAAALHSSLSDAAQAAGAHDGEDQPPVVEALQRQNGELKGSGGNPAQGEFPEFQAPHILATSAAGIQSIAERSTHIASNEHTAITSGGHTSISTGKSLLASVKERIRLFAYKAGIKLVAATADVDIVALKNCINLMAQLDIKLTADTINISAKTKLSVSGGGSGTTWDAGGITSQTSGQWVEKAASFSMSGGASVGTPSLPQGTELPMGQLDLLHRYVNQSAGRAPQGVRQTPFNVVDSEGGSHSGTLDAMGFNSVASIPMGMAEVTYEKDPRDPWDQGSYLGEDDWKAQGAAPSPATGALDAASAAAATAAAAAAASTALVSAATGAGGQAMAHAAGGTAISSLAATAGIGSTVAMAQQGLVLAQAASHGDPLAAAGQMASQMAAQKLGQATSQASNLPRAALPPLPTKPTVSDRA